MPLNVLCLAGVRLFPVLQAAHAVAVSHGAWFLHCECVHDPVLGDPSEGLCSHVQPSHRNCGFDIGVSVHEVSLAAPAACLRFPATSCTPHAPQRRPAVVAAAASVGVVP